MTDKPLAGVRVLELARILAGPWSGQMLADLGAEVIKVERPEGGDDTRAWGPPFVADADGRRLGLGLLPCAATAASARSRSISKASDGRATIRRLAGECDVVIENFKVGGLAKFGLDADSLRAALSAPRLLLDLRLRPGRPLRRAGGLRLHHPGHERPDGHHRRAGARAAEGRRRGGRSLHRRLRRRPRSWPRCDGAIATASAPHIDMALMDCAVAMLANQAMNYLASGRSPTRLGNAHPNIAPYQVFAVADGHVIVAVGNDRQFQSLCARDRRRRGRRRAGLRRPTRCASPTAPASPPR